MRFSYQEHQPNDMNISKLAIAAAFSAALVFAQGRGPGGTPPDPQTMIQRRVDFLASQLSLTDSQKAKAVTIFTDAYTASQDPRTQLRTASQSLNDAVKKDDLAAIDRLSATTG